MGFNSTVGQINTKEVIMSIKKAKCFNSTVGQINTTYLSEKKVIEVLCFNSTVGQINTSPKYHGTGRFSRFQFHCWSD